MKLDAVGKGFAVSESPPTRGAWIEIKSDRHMHNKSESPPTRGAWIEIKVASKASKALTVAPHTGGVD